MHGLAPYFLGGLVAVTLTNWFATIPGSDPAPGAFAARAQAALLTTSERSHKGDRLAPPVASGRKVVVSAIEVVGARRTSIVYRDRDGPVLFRSDTLRRHPGPSSLRQLRGQRRAFHRCRSRRS